MDKRKNTKEIVPAEKTYKKSNKIINAKGKSSALGLKLFAIGINAISTDENGHLVAKITGKSLRELFSNKNGSFYTEIKSLIEPQDPSVPSILDWRIYMNDDANEKVEGINVVTNAKFSDGMLTMTFNDRIRQDIYNLKGNYTRLSLSQMIQIKSTYAIRLYEILKSHMDKEAAIGNKGPIYTLRFDYMDLREMVGITPIGRKDGAKKNEPLASYTSFRRQVLDKSVEEINSKTSVYMKYRPIKVAHGAVSAIEFTISRQNSPFYNTNGDKDDAIQVSNELTETEKNAVKGQVMGILIDAGIDVSVKDIFSICEVAEYDYDKIKIAVSLCQKTSGIKNKIGWIIAAIREGYEEKSIGDENKYTKTSRKRKSRVKKNSFNDFPQNQYNFEELEKQLTEN